MNKKGLRLFLLLLLLLLGIASIWLLLFFKKFSAVDYQEGTMVLDNPRRGYYWQVDSARADKFAELEQEGFRVVFLAYDIAPFSSGEISQEKLEELSAALEEAREHHLAVIFRAAYGFDKTPKEPNQLETMSTHVNQISAVLNAHADNILCVQAGLLGPYGEWHSGRYLSQEEEQAKTARLYLLKQWEAFLDSSITVAVRRPRFIREAAEQGIMKGRLTFHNDALISTHDDMGTYDDANFSRAQELAWVEDKLTQHKVGGEMPTLGEQSRVDRADQEFRQLHLGYLNRSYQKEIFEDWIKDSYKGQNAEQYIQNHLGYRWHLAYSKLPEQLPKLFYKNIGMPYMLQFENSGYAPLDDCYNIYLLVQRGEECTVSSLKSGESYSACNGERVKFSGRIRFPESLGETVKIGIKIAKDVQESDEKNSIKLANETLSLQEQVYWIARYELNSKGVFILEE